MFEKQEGNASHALFANLQRLDVNRLAYFEKFNGKTFANGFHVRNHAFAMWNFPAIPDFWSEDMIDFRGRLR